jgi:hypothetical protein
MKAGGKPGGRYHDHTYTNTKGTSPDYLIIPPTLVTRLFSSSLPVHILGASVPPNFGSAATVPICCLFLSKLNSITSVASPYIIFCVHTVMVITLNFRYKLFRRSYKCQRSVDHTLELLPYVLDLSLPSDRTLEHSPL